MGSRRLTRAASCTILISLLIAPSFVKVAPSPVPADCLECICHVESNCVIPKPLCHIDVGSLSCGPYQIKEAYYQDALLKGGVLNGDWKNCSASFDCSERAVQGYMARYATASRLGHQPKCEDFARIHNGGPNGYKKSATDPYWSKVKKCLPKQSTPQSETTANFQI